MQPLLLGRSVWRAALGDQGRAASACAQLRSCGSRCWLPGLPCQHTELQPLPWDLAGARGESSPSLPRPPHRPSAGPVTQHRLCVLQQQLCRRSRKGSEAGRARCVLQSSRRAAPCRSHTAAAAWCLTRSCIAPRHGSGCASAAAGCALRLPPSSPRWEEAPSSLVWTGAWPWTRDLLGPLPHGIAVWSCDSGSGALLSAWAVPLIEQCWLTRLSPPGRCCGQGWLEKPFLFQVAWLSKTFLFCMGLGTDLPVPVPAGGWGCETDSGTQDGRLGLPHTHTWTFPVEASLRTNHYYFPTMNASKASFQPAPGSEARSRSLGHQHWWGGLGGKIPPPPPSALNPEGPRTARSPASCPSCRMDVLAGTSSPWAAQGEWWQLETGPKKEGRTSLCRRAAGLRVSGPGGTLEQWLPCLWGVQLGVTFPVSPHRSRCRVAGTGACGAIPIPPCTRSQRQPGLTSRNPDSLDQHSWNFPLETHARPE